MEETKNINGMQSIGKVKTSPMQGVGGIQDEKEPSPAENIKTPELESPTGPVVSSEAKIEPQPVNPPTPEQLEAEIATVVDKLVELIGIRVQVRAKLQEDGSYYVNLRSRNADGLLIGKRGMTIVSIQALVNQIMKHRYPNMPIDIFVDVGGYRKRREGFLKKKALAVAKIVVDTKRDMALDILTEREFRMVEYVLVPLGTVRVYSIGSGSKRTVIIAPL